MLRGINSDSIDLIYLDPPFNKGKAFHAPTGTSAEGANFKDIWSPSEVKDELHNQLNDKHPKLYRYLDVVGEIGSRPAKYYLIYMAVRLLEMHRILKDTGSLYLHCDPTASHYLKQLMDCIFGHKHYRNEIVWCYTGPSGARNDFPRKHDVLFRYVKTGDFVFNFDLVRIPYKDLHTDKGKKAAIWGTEGKLQDPMERHKYLQRGKIPEDYWTDIPSGGHISPKERVGYPTQKPLKLLERIIQVSSNEGDLVLDPFCGCATTCVAAEKLERNWIGIDVSKKAYQLVQDRLQAEVPRDLFRGNAIYRTDIPARTDISYKKDPTKEDKKILCLDQNFRCKGCLEGFKIFQLEIDHIVPKSQGGSHELDNLQLLCGNCNRIKGNRPMDYLHRRIKALQGHYST